MTKIFLTGCTGFLGLSITDYFLGTGCEVWSLSRFPQPPRPHLHAVQGDIRTFTPPEIAFDFAIHGASDVGHGSIAKSGSYGDSTTTVAGTRNLLAGLNVRQGIYLSSGAVYGPEVPCHVTEQQPLAPAPGYGAWKVEAEQACASKGWIIARLFSFIGPGIPLTGKFAAGNFIRDALDGGPIHVLGSPGVLRGYLDAGELAAWLSTMLIRGRPGRAYNVGSRTPTTMMELAETIARMTGTKVLYARPPAPSPVPVFVPSTERALAELGLSQQVSLAESLRRTLIWATRQEVCP